MTTERKDHNIWSAVGYDDAHAARAWLAQLGFEEGIVVPDDPEKPDGPIMHSEMLWPDGGRVMVHSRSKQDTTHGAERGAGRLYVVCNDSDAVYQRAKAIGATILRDMEDTDYGSHGFSITDVEGNQWSFGTYAG